MRASSSANHDGRNLSRVNPYVSLHQNAREKTRVKTGEKAREKTRVKTGEKAREKN